MTLITTENKATNSSLTVKSTVRDLISDALYNVNVISTRETPPNQMINVYLRVFNRMVQEWYNTNVIVSFTPYTLDDIPGFDIGTTNLFYFDDCYVDNLSLRIIEAENIDPKGFPQIRMRARYALDTVINLKRNKEFDAGLYQQKFDATLSNTPDIESVYYHTSNTTTSS